MTHNIIAIIAYKENVSRSISSLGGSFIQANADNMSLGAKVSMSAVIGGTAEKLGGGKFANGAVTGAYVMMFNHLMHEWHPSRMDAASNARDNTINTGNETVVLVFEDADGVKHYWECPPHEKNSPTSAYWVWPPAEEMQGLKLVEEFHYSVRETLIDGKPHTLKGSYKDWLNARNHNIRVTHHTIGIGAWIFQPSQFFKQPHSIIIREYIPWDKRHPIIPPK